MAANFLRTGGFSSTQWNRNFTKLGEDRFGRAILGPPIDPTVGNAQAHGSFSRGNFHQFVVNLTRRFANRSQFFVNYAWSLNKDNASSERDTDTFFGPQDPFDIELDYGRNGLDIPHQFKAAFTAEVGAGIRLGGLFIARSGVPYPAYILQDTNGQGVDCVIECVGHYHLAEGQEPPLAQAVKMIRHGGRIVTAGLGEQLTAVHFKTLVLKEARIDPLDPPLPRGDTHQADPPWAKGEGGGLGNEGQR